MKVQDVARDLGVRYILEGSVQRADDALRVNAQLIDAPSGHHVWAERYDRKAEDFFAVQNEITREVVGVIYPIGEGRGRLVKAELERIAHTPTENLEAYDYFLQGRVYADRFNKEDNLRAREMFKKAIELDPSYAFAMTRYVWTYLFDYWWSWTDSPEEALGEAMKWAERAIAADPTEPHTYYALASVYLMQKKHDQAIRSFKKAYDLNRNDAQLVVEYGWGLALAGRTQEGIQLMQEATRLNPYHPDWYWVSFSEAYFVAGQYQEAVTALEKITQPWSHVYKLLAGNYAQMNRLEDARAALAKFLEMADDSGTCSRKNAFQASGRP